MSCLALLGRVYVHSASGMSKLVVVQLSRSLSEDQRIPNEHTMLLSPRYETVKSNGDVGLHAGVSIFTDH